ncbi:MAG: hypothetical protein E6J72_03400 [Deltaproteobacteria bacterium]|nr:MAG: hypothetical protein E6J72_03400 [Deltaproteobacteria bacterium]
MIAALPSRLVVIAIAAVIAVALPRIAAAGRCTTGLISGGFHCGTCPDPTQLPSPCGPDEEEVIFDLDKPFGFDGTTTSSVTMRAAAKSPCGAGFEKTEAVDGYMIGCWGPPDDKGCRALRTPSNGNMCLRINDEPLGCPGDCATVRTGQIAISNAGGADRQICPPKDETTCRSTRGDGETEQFQLWIGGLCSTNGCEITNPEMPDEQSPGPDTCTTDWGATLFGYSRGTVGKASPPGFYHWKSGTFDLEVTDGKPSCGLLGQCLGAGFRSPWTLRIVGTPRPGSNVPCLGADVCSPLPDGDPGCL